MRLPASTYAYPLTFAARKKNDPSQARSLEQAELGPVEDDASGRKSRIGKKTQIALYTTAFLTAVAGMSTAIHHHRCNNPGNADAVLSGYDRFGNKDFCPKKVLEPSGLTRGVNGAMKREEYPDSWISPLPQGVPKDAKGSSAAGVYSPYVIQSPNNIVIDEDVYSRDDSQKISFDDGKLHFNTSGLKPERTVRNGKVYGRSGKEIASIKKLNPNLDKSVVAGFAADA